jgi:hypothetical protein
MSENQVVCPLKQGIAEFPLASLPLAYTPISSINSHKLLTAMAFFSLITLFWLSGGFVIHHSLPTWALVVYSLISFISFFAWAMVRSGLLRSGEVEQYN